MDSVFRWFQNNLDVVFFVYGLAFISMGLTILIQPTKGSRFKLANLLWLLALFGLIHGIHEWLNMWALIRKGTNPGIDLFQWLFLFVSYLFLFEFGRRLTLLIDLTSHSRRKKITELLPWWLMPVIGMIIIFIGFISADFFKTGNIWTRYLLGLPGGLLTGFGFFAYYFRMIAVPKRAHLRDEGLSDFLAVRIKKYFFFAGLSFSVYSILGGLFVPKSAFFPNNWCNTDLFFVTVKIPIQVFRAACAVIAAWSVNRIIKIFSWEHSNERLKILTRLYKTIAESNQMIVRIKNREQLLKEACRILVEHGEFKRAWIGIADFDTGEVHPVAWAGFEDGYLEKAGIRCDDTPHGRGPAGTAIRTGKQVVWYDTETDKNFMPWRENARIRGYRSAAAFPLCVHNKVIGAINVYAADIGFIDDEAVSLLDKLAGDIGYALQSIEETVALKKTEEEKEKLEIQLLQSVKLAAIGELASGLAHEIGNPLQTILGNAELLLVDSQNEELLAIKNASLHCKKTIAGLLDFSRQKEVKFIIEDINNLLEKTLALYGKQLELKKIKIVKNYGDLPKIAISAPHLQQVFLNLVTNAQKAMPKGGTLTITTRYSERKKTSGGIFRPDENGNFIEISFKDTGVGIPKENLTRLFEPFFTTKKDGTGLGLAVSYGIVKQHGGEILVFSGGENAGAEFVVKLSTGRGGGGGGVKTAG